MKKQLHRISPFQMEERWKKGYDLIETNHGKLGINAQRK